MRLVDAIDTKGQRHLLAVGQEEGTEQPIPQGERAAQILVEVGSVGRVVDLMVRGTQEQLPPHPGEGNPEMRVLKRRQEHERGEHQDIGAADREVSGRAAEAIVDQATNRSDDQSKDIREDEGVDRMDAKDRQRG